MSVRLYPETDITGLAAILNISKTAVEKAYRYKELETHVADQILSMAPATAHRAMENLALEVDCYIEKNYPEVFRARQFMRFGWGRVDPRICQGACGETSTHAEISQILKAHGLGCFVGSSIKKLYWC